MNEAGSKSLLARAATGHSGAAEEFVHRYEQVIRSSIRRRLGPGIRSRVDTDDIFQSTILAAVQELPRFRFQNERALVGWLNSIADFRVRKAVAHHRVAKRDPRRERPFYLARRQASADTSPPQRAERGEAKLRIREAVARLPLPDRRVVELRSYEGLSFREVADRLGLADKSAARHVLQRALRRLGDSLDSSPTREI